VVYKKSELGEDHRADQITPVFANKGGGGDASKRRKLKRCERCTGKEERRGGRDQFMVKKTLGESLKTPEEKMPLQGKKEEILGKGVEHRKRKKGLDEKRAKPEWVN